MLSDWIKGLVLNFGVNLWVTLVLPKDKVTQCVQHTSLSTHASFTRGQHC